MRETAAEQPTPQPSRPRPIRVIGPLSALLAWLPCATASAQEGVSVGTESTASEAGIAAGAGIEASAEVEDEGVAASADDGASEVESSAEVTESDDTVVESGASLFEESLSGATDTDTTSAGAVGGLQLNGYVRGGAFVGKIPGFFQGEVNAAYGEFALQARTPRDTYGDGFAEVRFRYGTEGTERPEYSTELREAYVNGYFGPLDLRIGQQIIVWGKADGFNPTNNLTPTDLNVRSPQEDDRRVGNFAARVHLNMNPIRLEGVWVPVYRPVELPENLNYPPYVVLGEPDFPAPEFLRGTWAARLHLLFGAVDASFSYLYGYAPFPGMALSNLRASDAVAEGLDPEIRLARTAYNQHVVGFDFSTTLGETIGLRGEAAYRMPLHYQDRMYAPRPDVQYVLGLDRNFGPISVIAQYLGRYTLDWQKDGPAEPGDPERLRTTSASAAEAEVLTAIEGTNQMLFQQLAEIQHLASLRLAWSGMHEMLNISALGLVNITTQEWVAMPKLGYRISDAMTMSLGGEIYAGPEDTLFGFIDAALSAGYVEFRYSY